MTVAYRNLIILLQMLLLLIESESVREHWLECPDGEMEIANVCVCVMNWASEKCRQKTKEEVDDDTAHAMSRVKCNSNGYPEGGRNAPTTGFRCNCDVGYSGQECEIPACNEEGTSSKDGGSCICRTGYEGPRCEYEKCSRGQYDKELMGCRCARHWGGKFCDIPNCQNGGRVGKNQFKETKCICDRKWYRGNACEFSKCKNGTVRNDRCECFDTFTGEFCDEKYCHGGRQPNPRIRKCVCNSEWSGDRCDKCDGDSLVAQNGFCCHYCYTGENCEIYKPLPRSTCGATSWLWWILAGIGILVGGICAMVTLCYCCCKEDDETPADPTQQAGGAGVPKEEVPMLPISGKTEEPPPSYAAATHKHA